MDNNKRPENMERITTPELAQKFIDEQLKELKEQLQHLETKLRDVKDKKQALIARANAAQAKQHMNESMNKVDSESAYKEFLRMENRIEEMETKAGSYAQFADQGAYAHLDYADEVEKEWQKLQRSKQLEKRPAN